MGRFAHKLGEEMTVELTTIEYAIENPHGDEDFQTLSALLSDGWSILGGPTPAEWTSAEAEFEEDLEDVRVIRMHVLLMKKVP